VTDINLEMMSALFNGGGSAPRIGSGARTLTRQRHRASSSSISKRWVQLRVIGAGCRLSAGLLDWLPWLQGWSCCSPFVIRRAEGNASLSLAPPPPPPPPPS